jgi:hypothetical protein
VLLLQIGHELVEFIDTGDRNLLFFAWYSYFWAKEPIMVQPIPAVVIQMEALLFDLIVPVLHIGTPIHVDPVRQRPELKVVEFLLL